MINNEQETHVGELYKTWFTEYASYVILERAIPHINDGLKPVQRRIMHALRELDDGRFNKVANVTGHCMRYHPHGDQSISDALVQLGQKDLLVDCQGNWGSPLTGDPAAASRYIEARLSKLAQDVLFNPKLTEWLPSYDGRNKEPVTLPAKFPLLLAQGVDGIAVGLMSKILPHNFNELLDSSIAILRGKTPRLMPDFPTGGVADFTDYQDGQRGGKIRARAKIELRSKLLLAITEVPYGVNTRSLMESIVAANNREKIKIRKIEDNTASTAEILLHLPANADPQKTINALFVFTDCEVGHSPNACVIKDGKPCFLNVTDLLQYSTERTQQLLKLELEIRLQELAEAWHASSLERLFIEGKHYRLIETAQSENEAVDLLNQALQPFRPRLKRDLCREDIVRLIELRFRRLAKYDVTRAEQDILKIEAEMAVVTDNLNKLTDYTIRFFQGLKHKYGKGRERRTKLERFYTIVAAEVVVANEKLYVNRAEGFVGYGIKEEELVGSCSTLDEVVAIFRDGTMKVALVSEKAFLGKDIMYVGILQKNDEVTTYNMAYADGPEGKTYVKRFNIVGITRDKLYDLTQGTPGSRVQHLTVKTGADAEKVTAVIEPGQGSRRPELEFDFSTLAVKNRHAQGNVLSKYRIKKVIRARC
jgi:topoisomerase IV subunit A